MFGMFKIRINWKMIVKNEFLSIVQVIGQLNYDDYKKLPQAEKILKMYFEQFKPQLIEKSINIIDFASKYDGRILEVENPNINESNNICVSFYLIFKNPDCLKRFIKACNGIIN